MVKAWKEQVVIPTYEVGKPEKNPMFLEIAFIREVAVSFILTLLSNVFQMKRKIILTMLFFLKMNI